MNEFNGRLDTVKKRASELKDKFEENIQSDTWREKI